MTDPAVPDPAPSRPVPLDEPEGEPAASPTTRGSAAVQPSPDPAGGSSASATDDTSSARAGRSRRLAALAAVLVLTVGLAALTALVVQRSRGAVEVASYYRPSSEPMTAARDAGRLLFSYDHRTIDEDFTAAKALTTGTFAKEYAQTTKEVVRPVAVENKAVVVASAAAQGISRAEPGEVVALVFVNQVTTSTKVQGEKVDQSRVRMTLVERGGRWLVRKVEAL